MNGIPGYKGDYYPLFDNHEELKALVNQMFKILDRQESNEDGRLFHPTYISSCRVMDSKNLNELFGKMKELTHFKGNK